MCYYRTGGRGAEKLRVAKQDITCWKILNDDMSSYIKRFEYKLGKDYFSIGNTLNLVLAKIFNWREVNYGYHAFVSEPHYFSWGDNHYLYEIVVKCTIPKGSLYYADGTHYVSNRLRIDEIRQKDGTWSTKDPNEMPKEVEEHINEFLRS